MEQLNILCEQPVEYRIAAKRIRPTGRLVKNSRSVAEYARHLYKDDIMVRESCFAIFLNRSNQIIGHALISAGGNSSTTIDKKMVAWIAINAFASSVILVHNHPSGNPKPGQADITVTADTRNALKLLDISLLDHIVVTEDKYYSLADEMTYQFN